MQSECTVMHPWLNQDVLQAPWMHDDPKHMGFDNMKHLSTKARTSQTQKHSNLGRSNWERIIRDGKRA